MAEPDGVSADSPDSTRDILKSIGERNVALLINLHYQFCLQALCYNIPMLQLTPLTI